MKNYNSNFKSSGAHTVKVTVADGIYRATFKVKVSGNCTGWSVLDAAVQIAFDDLIKDNEYVDLIMTNPNDPSDKLFMEFSDYDLNMFENMVISAKITKYE